VRRREAAAQPFESIEAAYEYVTLLAETALEARKDVADQQALARTEGAERREQGLQLAAYKLSQLGVHLHASRRLLNDLRSLRRLLQGERGDDAPAGPGRHEW
jgi:hypothetical protein